MCILYRGSRARGNDWSKSYDPLSVLVIYKESSTRTYSITVHGVRMSRSPSPVYLPGVVAEARAPAADPLPFPVLEHVPFPDKLDLRDDAMRAANWELFLQIWNNYEISSQLVSDPSERRTATLLTCFAPSTLKLYNSLWFERPGDKTNIHVVLRKMTDFCKGVVNETYERYLFNTRVQGPNEGVDVYYSALLSITKNCSYDDLEQSLIRDRLVVGFWNSTLRKKLLYERNLTDKGQAQDVSAVQANKGKRKPRVAEPRRKPSKKCFFCGNDFHKRNDCPAKEAKCNSCGKMGHFRAVCKSKQVHEVAQDQEGFHEDAFLGAVHGNSPGTGTWQTEVTVDGESITFKIDTGADVDVISRELYTGTFKHKPVHKVKKILRGPDGKPLAVRGYISCKLQKGEVSVRSDVYIVDGASALIGRASCKALGLVTLCIDSINSYSNLFSGLGEMPRSYRIALKPGAEPFAVTYPCRIPLPLMGRVKNELDRLETLEVITRITKPTDWCAPIVVVLKGEKIRICVDYTKLNNSVKREKHILPSVDHTLGQMAGATVFTRLDANSGFHHIKLTDESKDLSTFITPFGRYCYKRLPFGISSGPEHYQSQVHQVLENLPGVTCLLDDIVVFGTTEEEHDLRLDNVLKKLSEAGVTLNKAKCSFKQSEIKFLGHIVGRDWVKGDPDKVAAITGMAEPTGVSQLRRFLGMINQMGKFLPNLAALTEPLRQLLSKKNEWF